MASIEVLYKPTSFPGTFHKLIVYTYANSGKFRKFANSGDANSANSGDTQIPGTPY
jgi:hypothetical protein